MQFDFIDFILFIFQTVYVLYQGNRYNWLDDNYITLFSIFAFFALISFIILQTFKENSLIETKFFRTNNYSFAFLVSLVEDTALFGGGFIFSSFILKVLNLTLTQSGYILFYSGFMCILTIFFTAFIVQVLNFLHSIQ